MKIPRIRVRDNGTKTTVLSVSVKPPSGSLGSTMPKPDSKGKVRPAPGEPVTDIRIYPR